MDIKTINQDTKGFYATLGQFFVSPEVRAATGSNMVSEPEYRWTVAQDGKNVLGFAALAPKKNSNAEFTAIYTIDANTKTKRAIVKAALEDATKQGVKTVRVAAKLENAEFYRELGFVSGQLRGGFIALSKELS